MKKHELKERMSKMKKSKGITLVALIITIIILLILAVVAISAVNNTGIIQYAQNSVESYKGEIREEEKMLQEYMEYLSQDGSEIFNVKKTYNKDNDEVVLSFVLKLSNEKVIQYVSGATGDTSITDIDLATIAIIKELVGTDYYEFEKEYGEESLENQFKIVMQLMQLNFENVNELIGSLYLMQTTENLQLIINETNVLEQIVSNGLFMQYIVNKNGTYDIELIIDDQKYRETVVVSEISGDIIRIGETIEYSAGGVNDWKVFYKNDDYVYIIISGYLENRLLPSGLKMTTSGTYIANWKSYTDTVSQNGAHDIAKNVAEKFMLNWWNEDRTNTHTIVKVVADLLNTQIWSASFGDQSRGIEAVGGPTIDMWRASWKERGYEDFTISYDENGYYYGSIQTGLIDLRNKNGSKDQLYFPQSEDCGAYWLSSHMTYSYWGDSGNYFVYALGTLSAASYTSDIGIRPVVAIPINLVERNLDQILVVN